MWGIQYLMVLAVLGSLSVPASAQESWRTHYTRETAQTIFDRSVRKFLENFDRELFVTTLKKISDGEKITLREQTNLINARLRAQKIRAVYEFLDERHETPWDFNEFVITWGKLKDALNAGTDMTEYAHDLRKLIKNGALDFLADDFEPALLRDLMEYTDRRIEKMEKWAAKDALSLNKYHRLRKGLRSLYFVLKSLKLDQGDTETLVAAIKEREREMGLVHDRLEEALMRGEKVPKKLEVPRNVPSLIENAQRILFYTPKKGQTCRFSL